MTPREDSLDTVTGAAEEYSEALEAVEYTREALALACVDAATVGATQQEIADAIADGEVEMTRQRVSQLIKEHDYRV